MKHFLLAMALIIALGGVNIYINHVEGQAYEQPATHK